MRVTNAKTVVRGMLSLVAVAALSACTTADDSASLATKPSSSQTAKLSTGNKKVYTYTAKDRDCLKRAMYFESQRTSESGFLAVGSVIMNRLTSGMYPPTICGVVSQEKQFAPGVMTRAMDQTSAPALENTADAILKGKRHPDVKEAMYFHQKGLHFRYTNMHYTAAAGGNVFYEKRDKDGELQTAEPKPVDQYVLAYADPSSPQTGIASALTAPGAVIAPATDIASSLNTASTTALAAVAPTNADAADRTPAPVAGPAVAPEITAEIAKASVVTAFDVSFPATGTLPLTTGAITDLDRAAVRIPVPLQRPDEQTRADGKRSGVGPRVDVRPNPA